MTRSVSIRSVRIRSSLLVCLAVLLAGGGASAQMVVESLSGPVTPGEIRSFKSFVARIALDTRNQNPSNKYAYKLQGGAMEALGDMHIVTGDRELLDRLIRFSDAILSGRNDMPNGEHTVMWSGRVQPVWPNTVGGTCWAGELGDILAHISYAAIRILRTPALAEVVVPDGNPYGFGVTYRDRALRYIEEVDHSIDEAILPYVIQSNLEQRFAADFCYKPDQRVPWNQQSMFNGAFQRQAEAHELLGDAPSRVALYDDIVETSMQLLLGGGPAGAADPVSCGDGQTCYRWAYNVDRAGVEDHGHGAYDVLGVYRAWQRGRAGVTQTHVTRLANTLMHRMHRGDSRFAERIDGTGADVRLDAEWLYLAHVYPEVYERVAANLESRLDTEPRKFGRLMYVKHMRHVGWSDAPARLFQHCGYGGWSAELQPGAYTAADLEAAGAIGDDASSLRVRDGYQVTLYHDGDLTGPSVTVTSDDGCFEGGLNDRVSSVAVASTAPATATLQERAAGFCGVDGTVDSNHAGHTGAGFANTTNTTGAGIDWSVVVAGGSYALQWRYASGDAGRRPGRLLVDGVVTSTVDFAGTGSWTAWSTITTTVTLSPGAHVLRLESAAATGLANVDRLLVTGNGALAAGCR